MCDCNMRVCVIVLSSLPSLLAMHMLLYSNELVDSCPVNVKDLFSTCVCRACLDIGFIL